MLPPKEHREIKSGRSFISEDTVHSFSNNVIKSRTFSNDVLNLQLSDVGVTIFLGIVRVTGAWSLMVIG